MDFSKLPDNGLDFIEWDWDRVKPYFDALASRPLEKAGLEAWMGDWNRLSELLDEAASRLHVASTQNTEDAEAEARFTTFNEGIRPKAAEAEQVLKDRLLASGLAPDGFDVPLAKMKLQAQIYRSDNLPLLSEDLQMTMDYYKVRGAEQFEWDGEMVPVSRADALLEDSDRAVRERAWRLKLDCFLKDKDAIDDLWLRMLKTRAQIARNAGEPDYRSYRWKQLLRLDYTPDDTLRFHDAIEEVVVPVAKRLREARRKRLGQPTLLPWDVDVEQFGSEPLKPFSTVEELIGKSAAVFHQVDPELGAYFDIMREEGLIDVESRPNKAPGGYMLPYEVVKRPFIFFTAEGIHEDVMGMLHEGGHSFHAFEMAHIRYLAMRGEVGTPMEFSEVGSMAMELLGLPYLDKTHGGFYDKQEMARAWYRSLEAMVLFWPYMSTIDSYQHWVYTHIEEAMDIAACDAKWASLWSRFMKVVDYTVEGTEDFIPMRWRIQGHLFDAPFYYIEYGLAQMGAVQVWGGAQKDQAAAVARYRAALRLGGSKRLPELFAAAGANLAYDAATLKQAVKLIEDRIDELEQIL